MGRDTKVTTSLVQLYTSACEDIYEIGEGGPGVECLERCNAAIQDLEDAKTFVRVLENNDATGAQVIHAARTLLEDRKTNIDSAIQINLPDFISVALKRDATRLSTEQNWAEYVRLLAVEWTGDPKVPPISRAFVGKLPELDRVKTLTSLVMKPIADASRLEPSVGVPMLKKYMKALNEFGIEELLGDEACSGVAHNLSLGVF